MSDVEVGATGRHERAVVSRDRLLARVQAKAAKG